jgi:sulfotransferase
MNKTIFFQSSMPRAGSTLLQNIIGQNPYFYVTPTSSVSTLVINNSSTFYDTTGFKKEKDYNLIRKSFYNYCRGGINSYFSTITNKPYILDKSREWITILPLLNKIYPSPKVITLVRDLRSIYTSFEKYLIENPEDENSIPKNPDTLSNTLLRDRINFYQNSVLIEEVLNPLKDIIDLKNKSNIKLVRFEDLCSNPQQTLDEIYSYLEIPSFQHNFNQINQITYENDNFHPFGNHSITSHLHLPPTDYSNYFPPEALDYIYNQNRWYFEYFNYKK